MKATPSIPGRRSRGFTLIDTSLAIGLMGAMVLPILGLLALGSVETGKARGKRQTALLRDELRLRLQDPAWPLESRRGREWKAEIEFDRKGRLIKEDEARPWVRVSLEGMPAPGFDSKRFEAVKIRISGAHSERLMAEAVVQRIKKVDR